MNEEDQQAHWENLFQLSLTGELTQAQQDELELAFDEGFVPTTLPVAASRDFAAEAISQVMPVSAPRDFTVPAVQSVPPQRHRRSIAWGLAAAAALVAVLSITTLLQHTPPVSPQRQTAAISAQLDSIEAELTTPRTRTRVRTQS